MKKIRLNYLFISLLLLLIEITIAIYAKDEFIRPILGDYLAVILVFYFLAAFRITSENKTALLALSISYIIEVLQFMNILKILQLEEYKILRIVFGTSFSWMDMLAYTLGIATVFTIHNYKKLKS